MIIIPQLLPGQLNLNAYSYQEREFDIVRKYLQFKDFSYITERIRKDYFDRLGYVFRLTGQQQILRFQITIGVTFEGAGPATTTSFAQGDGGPYHCVRLKSSPGQEGCEDITAEDENAAFIKCALVANEKKWFGADAKPGCCED